MSRFFIKPHSPPTEPANEHLVFAWVKSVWQSHCETHGDKKMRKALVVGVLGLGLLGGCAETPTITMQFKDQSETIMIGQMNLNGDWNTIHFDYEVTDGEITCSGKTMPAKSTLLNVNFSTVMSVNCDTGSNGKISANLRLSEEGLWNGVGVGKLNDGTKIRIVVGQMSGNLEW